MAESSAKGDDDVELLASNCSLQMMMALKQMISRQDWFDVYKGRSENEEQDEPKTQSDSLEPIVVPSSPPSEKRKTRSSSLDSVELIVVPSAPSEKRKTRSSCTDSLETIVPSPPAEKRKTQSSSAKDVDHTYGPPQNSRRKTRAKSGANEADDTYTPPQKHRKKTRAKSGANEDEHTYAPPQKRQKRTKAKGTRRSRRGRKKGCSQPDTQQETIPEIVLSDGDSEIEVTETSGVQRRVTRSSALNDSVEVIFVNRESEHQNGNSIFLFFCWKNDVLKLPMNQFLVVDLGSGSTERRNKTTKFGTILSTLSREWQVQGSDIMLSFNDKIIGADDSPGTLALLSGTIIDCSVLESQTTLNVGDPNVIIIKFQNKYSRDKKSMAVHKMKDFKFVREQYAKEEGIDADKIVFKFDGDIISSTDTPFGLGMESNDAIDIIY